MSTGSALLDLYCAEKGVQPSMQKAAMMQKTAEQVRLEKLGSAARKTFDQALEQYLFDFALTDLSR